MAEHHSRRFVLATVGTISLGLAGCLNANGSSASGEGGEDSSNSAGGDGESSDSAGDTHDASDSADGGEDSSNETEPSEPDADDLPKWMTTELEDVTSDETFTVAEFDVPVLLETFAVWCPDCLEQQEESTTFHAQSDLDAVSIGLNVDPNEDADVVRDHAETHGFDWRFAVSPPDLTRSLADEFGQSIAHPPASPVVLICPDGTFRRLEDGLVTADALESAVEDGC